MPMDPGVEAGGGEVEVGRRGNFLLLANEPFPSGV